MLNGIYNFFRHISNFLNPLLIYFSCLLSGPSHINDVMFNIFTDPYEDINCIKDLEGNKLSIPAIKKCYDSLREDKNRKDLGIDDASIEFLTNDIIDIGPQDYTLKAYYKNFEKDQLFVYFYGVGKTMFWTSLTGDPYYTLKTNMKNDFDLLIPEYPGYGVNNFKTDRKNLEKMLDVYTEWITDNYHGKKIIIGGHSFGCWLALKLANALVEEENIDVIMNNPFFNNQTSMLWVAGRKYGEKFVKLLTSVEYENDKLIKNLEGKNVNIFITAIKKDAVCSYDDAVKLAELGDYVHFIKVKNNSRNFKHTIHRYVNHEQNLWIAKNILQKNYNIAPEDYEKFKKDLLQA